MTINNDPILSIEEANIFLKQLNIHIVHMNENSDFPPKYMFSAPSFSKYTYMFGKYFYRIEFFSHEEILIASNEIRRMFNLKAFL